MKLAGRGQSGKYNISSLVRKSFEGNSIASLSTAKRLKCTQQDCAQHNVLANEVLILVSGLKSIFNRKISWQTDFFVFTFTEDFCVCVFTYSPCCVGEQVCTQPLTFGLCTSTVCSYLLQPKQINLNLLCNLLNISLFNPAEAQVSMSVC